MNKVLTTLLTIWTAILISSTYQQYMSDLKFKDAMLVSKPTFYESVAVNYLKGCVHERILAYGKFSGALKICKKKANLHAKEVYQLVEGVPRDKR